MMLTLATLIFGTIGLIRRSIPISSAMLACFRGLSGAAFLLVFMKLTGKKLRHGTPLKIIAGFALSGMIMGINWILLFEAYNYTTVAAATLCYYMEPTIVILLSPLLFKERLTGKKLFCASVSIVGMILVSGIADNGIPAAGDLKGIFFGLGAACFYSGVVIMNKKLPGVDAYEKTVIQLIAAAVLLLPYLAATGDVSVAGLSGKALICLLTAGLVHTGVAYALYFGSMDGLKAQSIAIFSYIDPVAALILSAVVLHEPLTGFGILGAVMILAAALFGELSV